MVDGQENPLAIIQTAKLYEVQKYCSLTNHMWDGFWFLANGKAWEGCRRTCRRSSRKHVNAAGVNERADVAALNATVQKDLAAKGMAFNQPTRRRASATSCARPASTPSGRPSSATRPGRCWTQHRQADVIVDANDNVSLNGAGRVRVARLDSALGWLVEVPAAVLVVADIVVLFAGVVSRFVLHKPLVWSDELASMLFLWLAMLGAVIALRRGEHMRMTAFVELARARAARLLEAVGDWRPASRSSRW